MIDNKTKTQRLKLCARADIKYYKLVLNNLFGAAPPPQLDGGSNERN